MGRIKPSQGITVVGLVSLGLVLILGVAVAACGGGTPTPTPTATPTVSPTPSATATSSVAASPIASILAGSPAITGAQVCADLAAFQASLDKLTGLTSGSAAIRDVLGAVEATITTGQAFVDSAKATFGPEAQALGTALAGLQAALQGISGDGSLGDKAATVENAIDEVAAAFDALKAKVEPGCPAPEASGS